MLKLIAISDQHGYLPDIPPCDFLLLAGDILPVNRSDRPSFQSNWMNFKLRKWLDKVPARHIIAVAGNHDSIFDGGTKRLVPKNLRWHYLQDSGVKLEGIKFWGSPHTLPCGDWAFRMPEDRIHLAWEAIPDDTQILLTHQPPFGYGDSPYANPELHHGCSYLLARIVALPRLRVHVFGHIHSGHGYYGRIPEGPEAYNVSLVDCAYLKCFEPTEILFDPAG